VQKHRALRARPRQAGADEDQAQPGLPERVDAVLGLLQDGPRCPHPPQAATAHQVGARGGGRQAGRPEQCIDPRHPRIRVQPRGPGAACQVEGRAGRRRREPERRRNDLVGPQGGEVGHDLGTATDPVRSVDADDHGLVAVREPGTQRPGGARPQ
jgi:hypothetical protein